MRIVKYNTLLDDDKKAILVKESGTNYAVATKNLDTPEKIAKMLSAVFQADRQTEEHVYLICMDTKCHVQGVFEVTRGTVNLSMISPREIFQKALLVNATNIVIAHNHPSGDPTMSANDVKATERVEEAGKLMNINLLDSIVVGDGKYFSYQKDEYDMF